MIELREKYNSERMFTEQIEQTTYGQSYVYEVYSAMIIYEEQEE